MSSHRLDVPEFRRRLDAKRSEQGLSWRQVAAATGIPSSTFIRLSQGHAPDVHALVSCLVWMDLDSDVAYFVQPAA